MEFKMMKIRAQKMRRLTLKLMMQSIRTMVAKDELNIKKSGNGQRKGNDQFGLLRSPLDT
jgi:hypothetical protein